MRRTAVAVLVLGVLVAGCSSDPSLSEAFCNDLEAGYSPQQIMGAFIRDGTYSAKKAADLSYGFAASSCREQLRDNELLRLYLENWGIDPDTGAG